MIAQLEREEVKMERSAPDSASASQQSAAAYLLSSTSALGTGIVIERALGFLANLLAARIGGAETFGAYSLAITTADNTGTYTAGGIGATAAQFSGKYPLATTVYPAFVQVVLIVSVVSIAVAAAVLWTGSARLAHLLQKENVLTAQLGPKLSFLNKLNPERVYA